MIRVQQTMLLGLTLTALSCDETTTPSVTPPPAPIDVAPINAEPRALREGVSSDGTYRVGWEPIGGVIPDADPFAVRFTVTRSDAQPLTDDVRASIDAEMPHHGHGMNLVPTVKRDANGSFVASGMLLHMSGRWVVSIDVQEHGVTERTQWYVDIE